MNEGHPDKLCDQVSDAVLDACLKEDPKSKVACETAVKDNMVMVLGEITTQAKLDYDKIVRGVVEESRDAKMIMITISMTTKMVMTMMNDHGE